MLLFVGNPDILQQTLPPLSSSSANGKTSSLLSMPFDISGDLNII